MRETPRSGGIKRETITRGPDGEIIQHTSIEIGEITNGDNIHGGIGSTNTFHNIHADAGPASETSDHPTGPTIDLGKDEYRVHEKSSSTKEHPSSENKKATDGLGDKTEKGSESQTSTQLERVLVDFDDNLSSAKKDFIRSVAELPQRTRERVVSLLQAIKGELDANTTGEYRNLVKGLDLKLDPRNFVIKIQGKDLTIGLQEPLVHLDPKMRINRLLKEEVVFKRSPERSSSGRGY